MRFTINLLPPAKQQELHAGLLVTTVETILLLFFVLITVFAVTVVSLRFVLKGVQNDLSGRIEQLSTESESPRSEIKKIDTYLKGIDLLQRQTIRWSTVLTALAKATPKGVHLSEIEVTEKGIISIHGVAPTREDVLRFKDGLDATKLFSEVSSPLSNILQRTDVQFSFEAMYPPLVELAL
jgi:Tfp pilus assembly protein PilN